MTLAVAAFGAPLATLLNLAAIAAALRTPSSLALRITVVLAALDRNRTLCTLLPAALALALAFAAAFRARSTFVIRTPFTAISSRRRFGCNNESRS